MCVCVLRIIRLTPLKLSFCVFLKTTTLLGGIFYRSHKCQPVHIKSDNHLFSSLWALFTFLFWIYYFHHLKPLTYSRCLLHHLFLFCHTLGLRGEDTKQTSRTAEGWRDSIYPPQREAHAQGITTQTPDRRFSVLINTHSFSLDLGGLITWLHLSHVVHQRTREEANNKMLY